jgi:uncharacterized membrane protein YqiK
MNRLHLLADSSQLFGGAGHLLGTDAVSLWLVLATVIILLVILFLFGSALIGARYIPNDGVGVIEKLWSARGSVKDGHIIALNGEAGYQADLLRGGWHFRLWPFK